MLGYGTHHKAEASFDRNGILAIRPIDNQKVAVLLKLWVSLLDIDEFHSELCQRQLRYRYQKAFQGSEPHVNSMGE